MVARNMKTFHSTRNRIIRKIISFFDNAKTARYFPKEFHIWIRKAFINPLTYRFLYDDYLDHQTRRSSWSREKPMSRLGLEKATQVMQPWLDPFINLLDLGCGDGYILDLIKPQTKIAIGIDYHFGKLMEAHKYGNPTAKADFHYLPFANATFDIIHCSHVLEHSLDANKMLSEMARVLKPLGQCLIVIPSTGHSTIKHPNLYLSIGDLNLHLSRFFDDILIWEDNTREPEYWVTCRNKM